MEGSKELKQKLEVLLASFTEQKEEIANLSIKVSSLEADKGFCSCNRSKTNSDSIFNEETKTCRQPKERFTQLEEVNLSLSAMKKYDDVRKNCKKIDCNKVGPEQTRNSALEVEKRIREQRKSYGEGLTIHGLNRVVTGGIFSKIVWSVLLIVSIVIAVLISKQHWDEYLSNRSTIKLTIVSEREIEYPSITICNYFGIVRERRYFEGGEPLFNRPKLVNVSSMRDCGRNLTRCGYNDTMFLKAKRYNADYTKSTQFNHLVAIDNTTNCFTVSGSFQKVPSNILALQSVADRTHNLWSELFINPTEETFFEASPTVYWASEGWYHAVLTKKIITRLGLSYTECIEGSGTYSQNKFKGNYTVNKCKKGCFWEMVFEKCGAIPPMYKKHMREPHRFDNNTFVSDREGQNCLREVENDAKLTEKCNALCQLQPCYEEDFKISLDYHNALTYPNFLELAFTFQTLMVENLEEIPAYSWQDLFANFGCCVGLMTGASILSLFELCSFIGLIVMDYFTLYTKVTSKILHNVE